MKLSKKAFGKKAALVIVSISFALAIAACNPDDNGEKSGLSGKVSFANSASTGKITLYLDRTDGLHAKSVHARTIGGSGTRSTTANADGSYSFEDVAEGIYTVYAASEDYTEQAVLINIPVQGETETTADPMTLMPVGSIKGQVILDGSQSENLGFTVFIAGTSYTAITNSSGYFEISNVPAGVGFEIAVMRGNFAAIWATAFAKSGEATELGLYEVTTSQLNGDAIIWRGVLNSHPANPQKN